MNTYRAEFYGRKQGASAVYQNFNVEVHGKTEIDARLDLYNTYEKIQRLTLTELCGRCGGEVETEVNTRSFGREALCNGCAVNVRRDGQEVKE